MKTIEAKQYWTSPNGPRTTTRYIVVHHAAYTYPPGKAVQMIYDYHRSKWPTYNACGYHEVIQREIDGSLGCYLVNPPLMQGAGVALRNHECYHICAAANFTSTPGDDWLDAYVERLKVARATFPQAQIVGHTDIALPGHGTSCPGPLWHNWRGVLLARSTPIPVDPWPARWGNVAPPNQTSWQWDIPQTWKAHWQRLGKCISHALYDTANSLVIQCFEGGDVRQRGKELPEVTFK